LIYADTAAVLMLDLALALNALCSMSQVWQTFGM